MTHRSRSAQRAATPESKPAEPAWLAAARADIGQRETLGPNDSPWIRAMLARLGASWLLGQPWCGGAVAQWMGAAGFTRPAQWYRAKAWASWGQPLDEPRVGCVVVFGRVGGGHVGLLVGRDARGRLLVLGGNQGNAVSVESFDPGALLAMRWPPGEAVPMFAALPLGVAAASVTQA